MFRTGAQFVFVVLLTGLLLINQSRTEPLATWENTFADFLAINSRRYAAPAPVVLVAIDDASLADHPWPWNPLQYSLFFQAALPLKPEAICIDQVLDWDRAIVLSEDQNRKLAQYEKLLRSGILRAPKMLLGATLGVPADPQVVPPLQAVPLLRNVHGPLSQIPEYTAVELEPSESYRLTAAIGFTNLPPAYRRFNATPMLFRYRGQVTPSFTLQAILLWSKLTLDDVVVQVGSHIDIGKKFRVPIDATGRMRVDFGVGFERFGFDEVLLASEQKEAGSPPIIPIDKLAGSVVLLSRTDPAARTVPLAARRNGSPGELFAAAIATIQTQSFIQPAAAWTRYLVVACFAVLSYFAARWKKWHAFLFGILSLAVYALIALAIFGAWLIWLPGVAPFGEVAVFVLLRVVTPDSIARPRRPVIL